jgi:hypothetical protein
MTTSVAIKCNGDLTEVAKRCIELRATLKLGVTRNARNLSLVPKGLPNFRGATKEHHAKYSSG